VAETQTKAQQWITYDQGTKMTSLSRWTLYRLAKAGHIKAARIGGATRLNVASIETLLEERASKYTSD
jgi:excisionase family DNA binding protein